MPVYEATNAVSDEEMHLLAIECCGFHGQCNYSLSSG